MEATMVNQGQLDSVAHSDINQGPGLGSNIELDLQSYLQSNPDHRQELAADVNVEAIGDSQAKSEKEKNPKDPKSSEKRESTVKRPHQKEETIKIMKAKVTGTIEYLRARGLPHTKQDVFEYFGIARTRGYEMLGNRDRRKRKPGDPETRGRPSKLSKDSVNRMDEILQAWGLEGRAMTWKGLAAEAEVPDVSWRTIQRTMQKRGYRRCKACSKSYAAPDVADVLPGYNPAINRGTPYMLEDGIVLHSENIQFATNPQHTLDIMRKPSENHCGNCNQQQDQAIIPLQVLPLS